MGDHVLEPIEVEPFTRKVGPILINIEPGDFIASYEPWNGLEYDT